MSVSAKKGISVRRFKTCQFDGKGSDHSLCVFLLEPDKRDIDMEETRIKSISNVS